MAAMFSQVGKSNVPARAEGSLLQIRAGRMRLEPGTEETKRKVISEPARGMLIIRKDTEGCTRFQWKTLENNAVVDDLYIFPNDATFMHVKECVDGKVYMLKFLSSGDRRVYWIQDSTPNIDRDLCKRVNDIINNVQSTSARPTRAAASGSATRAAYDPSTASRAIRRLQEVVPADDFENVLDVLYLNRPPEYGAAASGVKPLSDSMENSQGSASPMQEQTQFDLNDIFKGARVAAVIANNRDRLVDKVADMTGSDDVEQAVNNELNTITNHPEFQQAVRLFGYALKSGQLGSLLQQFSFPAEVILSANLGDPLDFATALTAYEATVVNQPVVIETDMEGHASSDEHMDTDPDVPEQN